MTALSKRALAVLIVVLWASPTAADDQSDGITAGEFVLCQGVRASGLACRVWLDFNANLAIYQEELATGGNVSSNAFAAFFMMPRFQAAVGQPGAAFQSITEWLRAAANDEYALWGNPTDGLYQSSSSLATDLLSVDGPADMPDAMAIDDPAVRTDALIVAGRLFAEAGEDQRSRAMFALAWDIVRQKLDGDMWRRAQQLRPLFAMWASADFVEQANAAAAALDPVDSGLARLAMAEGLAAAGEIEATAAIADDLPGWLPVLGKMALAESYRRQGQDSRAHDILDEAAGELDAGVGAARTSMAYLRLAQGYAMLGDITTASSAMLRDIGSSRLLDNLARPDVAPIVACHDMNLALQLISDVADGQPEPQDVVAILIAASGSGSGQAAYDLATAQQDAFTRSLYLLAVAIGLKHRDLSPFPAIPCTAVSLAAY